LLFVRPLGSAVTCEIIGGTSDISAGQLVDRAGQRLGLRFPSGKELDALAATCDSDACYEPRTTGLEFSLSGVEHKMKQLADSGADAAQVARFTLLSIIAAVKRATENAIARYGALPILFSGGVASNALLRREFQAGIFAEPRYSVDNALGAAILTYRAVKAGQSHE
jgi:N6-L-threonylcarbamoyladenine synthase